MSITLEKFISQLDESGVISAVEITAFQQSQSPAAESAEELGKLLVKHKKVTKLQAQLVYQGKGDRLLLGNYLILDKIGAGGMGDVYLAEHRRMERQVALKTLPAAMTRDTQSMLRFHREVKAAAKLTHPNIVAAYDADEANGVHYFVMEYVEGIDLSAVVKKQGVLEVDVAVDYILQAAKGLEFAHNKGVIHRDIKPANLLLDNDGCVKILDMGLARIEDEAHEIPATQLTQDGSVMGTVDYMAPEQAKDTHTADARSDIYSLGCSLYYLLTGESVYRGSTMVNRIMAHQNDPIPSLTGKHILISQDVDAVFQKMVAKKPEDRFQSMSEVIVAIDNCIQMKSSSTVATEPSDPELHKFLQSQRMASSPTVVMSADAMKAEKPLTDTQNESLTSGFLNHTLGGTSYQPLAKRKQSIGKRGGIIAGLVLASLVLIAGIVFKIDTPAGTIILEVDQPELAGAVVSVDEQQKITIKTGKGTEPIEVVADEKTHTLQVTKGGFETFTKQFTVKAGGKETIKVRLEPLAVAEKKMPSAGTPAKSHSALRFQNDSDRVVLPLKHETAGDLTVEAWVTIDENSNRPLRFIANGSSLTSFGIGYSKAEGKEKEWSTSVSNNGQFQVLQTDSKVEFGKRTNIAVTYKGNVAQIYVNGHKQGEMNFTGSNIHTDEFITIGNRYKGPPIKGSIDEVRFSNIARYSEDFTPTDHFENDKNTLALYHFDEGTGDVLKDASGNGHDGKIVGAKWIKVDDELQVTEPATTGEKPMTEREVAEWVLSTGGGVGLNRAHKYNTIKKLEDLPKEPFFVYLIVLNYKNVTDDGLRLLKDLTQLSMLYAKETPVTNAGMQYLAKLTSLTELDISYTSVGDEGLQYLGKLDELIFLNLQRTKITDVGTKHLANLRNLVVLNLYETKTGDNGLEHIKNLIKIQDLAGGILTTDEGLKHLSQMKQLQSLALNNTQVTGSGLVHLPDPQKLVNLILQGSPVTDSGLQNVSKYTNLQVLYLRSTKITDAGLKHLEPLKQLKKLILERTRITDIGLKHLHDLKKLEDLDLRETKVTSQGIADLQKALPNCKIKSDFETKPITTSNSPMTDREIAEWVIGMGGGIGIGFKLNYKIEELPTEPVIFNSVSLKNASFEDHDLQRLAKLKTLKYLFLESTSISDTGLQYLRQMQNLEEIFLDYTKITDEGLLHLRGLQNLRVLRLSKTKITGEALGHLKDLPRLHTIDVNRAAITNSGMKAMGDLKQLTSLNISFNSQVDDTGLGYIEGLTKLEKLFAHLVPKITDEGLKHLQGMKQLETLTLSSTGITTTGLEQLTKHESLNKLDLTNCKITDSGLEHLQDLKNLRDLRLDLTPVSDAGLQHLYSLKKLENLDLRETKVTSQGIADLQKALPKCKIESDFKTKPPAMKAP